MGHDFYEQLVMQVVQMAAETAMVADAKVGLLDLVHAVLAVFVVQLRE